jgi:hypothetical protein
MKLLLWSDDLVGRMRLESLWQAAGVEVLKKSSSERPDCIVIDLAAREVLAQVARLRSLHADVEIIGYAARFDEPLFAAALAAGASDVAAANSIMHRVERRMAGS